MTLSQLQKTIERYFAEGPGAIGNPAAMTAFLSLRAAIESGEVRAASPDPGSPAGWRVNSWVKQGILLGFRIGSLQEAPAAGFSFVDKDTYPIRHFAPADGVRLVPGGSSVRAGAFLARGVVCLPPMYINAGAWVDEGTMVDSHALVGSCAQIGKRVHLSAAAQIGGVLEPVNASPVVIEDDVLVGGNCGVYEGTIVRRGAVLAPGTILTRGTPRLRPGQWHNSPRRRRTPPHHPGECGGRPRLPRHSKRKGPSQQRGLGPESLCAGNRQVS